MMGEGRAAVEENAPGFVVHLAKVEVDTATGQVAVKEYVASAAAEMAAMPEDLMKSRRFRDSVFEGMGEFSGCSFLVGVIGFRVR